MRLVGYLRSLGQCFEFPLIVSPCWLDDRNGIRPIKNPAQLFFPRFSSKSNGRRQPKRNRQTTKTVIKMEMVVILAGIEPLRHCYLQCNVFVYLCHAVIYLTIGCCDVSAKCLFQADADADEFLEAEHSFHEYVDEVRRYHHLIDEITYESVRVSFCSYRLCSFCPCIFLHMLMYCISILSLFYQLHCTSFMLDCYNDSACLPSSYRVAQKPNCWLP